MKILTVSYCHDPFFQLPGTFMYVMTITAHQAAIAFSQSALSFCWIQHFVIQQARAAMVEVRTQYLCLLTDLHD